MPKITKEQFAAMLNGRPLGQEMSTDEIKSAIASELVALLVSYDNIINIRGKIMVTERCFNNSIIGFGDNDEILSEYSIWYLEPQIFAGLPIINITCTLKDSELTIWQFETKIPHAVFHIINENGELQCGGIVMDYKDIYPNQATPETQKPEPYDEAYLNEKIEDGTKTWSGEDHNAFIDMVRGRDALITFDNLVKCGFSPCSYTLSNGHNEYKLPNGDYTIHLDHFTHKEKAQVVVLISKNFDDTFSAIKAFLSITTIPELQAAILGMLAANNIKFEFPVPIDTWVQITESE